MTKSKDSGGEPRGTVSRGGLAGLVMLALLTVPVMAQESSSPSPSRPGPTLTSGNNSVPAVDPTENVKALSEAANKRQDDLRLSSERLVEAKLAHIKEIADTHFLRNRELRESAIIRLDSDGKLRSEYEALLRQAEAKRIDAIRLVDVSAAATLAQRTTEQATALATVVTQSAEVLRNQVSRAAEDTRSLVATTAATALQNQQQQFQAITTRLAALEQSGAEGKGKQTFQDPAIAALTAQVAMLTQSRTAVAATGEGRGEVYAMIGGGLFFIFGVGGLVIAFATMRSKATARRA